MAVGLQREPWKKNKQYHADASTPTLKVSSGAPRRHVFGKPYVAVTPPGRHALMVAGLPGPLRAEPIPVTARC